MSSEVYICSSHAKCRRRPSSTFAPSLWCSPRFGATWRTSCPSALPPKPKAPKPKAPKVLDLSGVTSLSYHQTMPVARRVPEYIEQARACSAPRSGISTSTACLSGAVRALRVPARVAARERGAHIRVSRQALQSAGALHGQAQGHLVVEIPPSCDSVYEVDGVPFSVATHGARVPPST